MRGLAFLLWMAFLPSTLWAGLPIPSDLEFSESTIVAQAAPDEEDDGEEEDDSEEGEEEEEPAQPGAGARRRS